MRPLRAATRGSRLARAQTELVTALLAANGVAVEVVVVETAGDRLADVDIAQIGGQGVFVKEVQAAILDGRADIAVHSAKDLPSSEAVEGLVIGAVPARADPRDALVGSRLDDLPVGARVGTGSVRRRAQLAWLRPDLEFGPLRGNVDTRLAKAAEFDAIVVAAAALERLGRLPAAVELLATELLEVERMVPQVGQGALAVECRADDEEVRAVLATIEHAPSRRAVDAERAFLAELGGGCDRPVGAHATIGAGSGEPPAGEPPAGELRLVGVLAAGDGTALRRQEAFGCDPIELGRRLARMLRLGS